MNTHHPNFFMVGVVKGGTTSLHKYLDQHPEIYMSPIKEVNFFSRLDIDETKFAKSYAHDVDVDLKKFLAGDMKDSIHIAHVTNPDDYLLLFRNVKNEKIIGEASNSYILYEQAPKLISQKYPDAKILVMLRNPVERAFSQYVMNLRLGKTLEMNFIKEIQQDDNQEIKGWGANHQYLFIGKYYEQLKRYYDCFPKDQILICWYEDYKSNADKVVRAIYHFLEVNEDFKVDTSVKLNDAGVPKFGKLNYFLNQFGWISWAKKNLPRGLRDPFKKWMYTKDKQELPTMSESDRSFLINYYKEDIIKLQNLVGKDLSHWLA